MSAEVAVLTHESPGRTRLRIPARRNDGAYFDALARALEQCEGVEQVAANPRTASVLLLHSADLQVIFAFAEERELFKRPTTLPSDWVLKAVGEQLTALDDRLLERSGGKWGLSSLTFYALLAATGYQIYRGNVLPAAETLLHHTLKLLEQKNA